MKKTLLFILSLFAALPLIAQGYPVTNDLAATFSLFYWTNSAGSYSFGSATNLAPASNSVFSISTNGIAGLGIRATNFSFTMFVPWTNLPFGGAFESQIYAAAINGAAPAVETVPQTQTILRSYFLTGANPTEANYWEWIDTIFWYVNQMQTNEQAAVMWAQQGATIFPASAKFIMTNSPAAWWSANRGLVTNNFLVIAANNIASIGTTQIGSSNFIAVQFSNPLSTTNLAVYPAANFTTTSVIISNTVTGCLIEESILPGIPTGFYLQ